MAGKRERKKGMSRGWGEFKATFPKIGDSLSFSGHLGHYLRFISPIPVFFSFSFPVHSAFFPFNPYFLSASFSLSRPVPWNHRASPALPSSLRGHGFLLFLRRWGYFAPPLHPPRLLPLSSLPFPPSLLPPPGASPPPPLPAEHPRCHPWAA